MVEIISSISSAITLAKKLNEVSEKVKNVDFKMLLADLNLKLAEIKMQLAEVIEENTQLKKKVRDLESTEGEPCPKCRKRGWQLEGSHPDPTFGGLGGIRRSYKCSLCGYSEETLVTK